MGSIFSEVLFITIISNPGDREGDRTFCELNGGYRQIRSSAWLEHYTDNVGVSSSNLLGSTKDRELKSPSGGLAQLARAPALQAGGHRFDSDILHNPKRAEPV